MIKEVEYKQNSSQYLVWPPLASTTAFIRRGIDSYKDLRYAGEVACSQLCMARYDFPSRRSATVPPLSLREMCSPLGIVKEIKLKKILNCNCKICDALVNGNATNLCVIFLAFFEMSNFFLLLAISKRIELQVPDWRQTMGNSQKFQNLTDFCPIRCL